MNINNSKNVVANVSIGSIGGNFHVGDIIIQFADGTEQIFPLNEIKDKLRQDLWAEVLEKSKGKDFFEKIAQALQKPKKYLWGLPPKPEVFLGRAENLTQLHDKLFDKKQDNILLLVNGQGGIGKSTFAAKYYHEYHAEYQHLAWILAEPSILDAVLSLAMPLNINLKDIPSKQHLDVLLTAMENLDRPCLLVLDNANNIEDLEKYYKDLRKCSNFHILLTSKINELGKFANYKVLPLSKDFALQLFTEYYPQHAETENQIFYSLYDAIGGNTLVIEVLAKNLAEMNQNETFYSLTDLITDIQKKGLLQLSQQTEVYTDWQSFEKTEPENIIKAMYDLRPLGDEELYLLSNFSVLPPENIAYQTLKELLQPKNPRQFSDTLTLLYRKGWIDKNILEGQSYYKISPVVQEIARYKNKERLFEDCEEMVENIGLEYEKIRNNRLQGYWLVPFMEGLIKYLPTNYELIRLQNHLSNILIQSGQIEKAEQNQLNAKSKIDVENLQLYIGTNEILGVVYWKRGKIDEAITLFKQMELLLNLNPQTENPIWRKMLSNIYHHISLCYEDKKDNKMRKLYSNKCIELQKEKDVQDFLRLSYLYEDEGNQQKAFEEIQEGISLLDTPKNANTIDLAILLYRAGQLITNIFSDGAKIGLQFLEKAQTIFESQIVTHPDKIEYLYGQLAINHFRLSNLEKALFFAQKAKSIFEEHYGITTHIDYIKIQTVIQEIEAAIQKQKFENIGRNEPCPCGSGKKYKKCCRK